MSDTTITITRATLPGEIECPWCGDFFELGNATDGVIFHTPCCSQPVRTGAKIVTYAQIETWHERERGDEARGDQP